MTVLNQLNDRSLRAADEAIPDGADNPGTRSEGKLKRRPAGRPSLGPHIAECSRRHPRLVIPALVCSLATNFIQIMQDLGLKGVICEKALRDGVSCEFGEIRLLGIDVLAECGDERQFCE